MAESPFDDLYVRLKRYLHVGMEIPKYYPGCWASHKYFELDKLKAIDEIYEKDKNHLDVVNVIVKVILYY